MGRRSISTTKSGKFMNPTDQASKTFSHSFIMILLASQFCVFLFKLSFTSVAMLRFALFTLIVFFH